MSHTVLLSPKSIIDEALMGSLGRGRSTSFDAGLSSRALFSGASFDPELFPDDAGPDADEGICRDEYYLHTNDIPEEFDFEDEDFATLEPEDDDGETPTTQTFFVHFADRSHEQYMTLFESDIDDGDDHIPYAGSGSRDSFRKVPRRQGRLSLRRKKI